MIIEKPLQKLVTVYINSRNTFAVANNTICIHLVEMPLRQKLAVGTYCFLAVLSFMINEVVTEEEQRSQEVRHHYSDTSRQQRVDLEGKSFPGERNLSLLYQEKYSYCMYSQTSSSLYMNCL